jgi:hypothetical protein
MRIAKWRIAKWRIALVGTALIALGVVGAGMVSAAPAAPVSGSAADVGQQARDALRKLARDRHVVHGVLTVETKDGTLVTIQLDRGTIASVGGGSLTISEKGGRTETVATNTDTRVRKDGAKSDLSKLAVGDTVVVTSELSGSTPIAKLIVVPRPLPKARP